MGIEEKNHLILRSYFYILLQSLPLFFIVILLVVVSILTFCRTKSKEKGTAQTKSVARSSAHEFSLGENILRSAFACRQLSLDSRGMRKFGRAYSASENLHLFSAPLCGHCL